jgi:hypothetical protein
MIVQLRYIVLITSCWLLFPLVSASQVHGFGLKKPFYVVNPFQLKSSLRHEIGMSFLTHFYRSPDQAIHYQVNQGIAYPQPVFNEGFGVFSLHYEPRLRLIEYKSWASLSLDFPLVFSLSIMDLKTEDGFRFSTDTVSDASFNAGIYEAERGNDLGFMHVEAGFMASINLFQGATYENTAPIGLSLGLGIHRIYSPLAMNFLADFQREDYAAFDAWWTPVSRLSLHFRGIVMAYTIGVNPTRVYYETLNAKRAVNTNTYNRFSISLRIGR